MYKVRHIVYTFAKCSQYAKGALAGGNAASLSIVRSVRRVGPTSLGKLGQLAVKRLHDAPRRNYALGVHEARNKRREKRAETGRAQAMRRSVVRNIAARPTCTNEREGARHPRAWGEQRAIDAGAGPTWLPRAHRGHRASEMRR